MKKKDFNDLCESIRQAGKILRGELKPGRVAVVEAPPAVQAVRKKLKLSQAEFAAMIGVPKSTIQGWEQGRRLPDAPAKALLKVAAKHPEAVLDALHGKAS